MNYIYRMPCQPYRTPRKALGPLWNRMAAQHCSITVRGLSADHHSTSATPAFTVAGLQEQATEQQAPETRMEIVPSDYSANQFSFLPSPHIEICWRPFQSAWAART